MIESNGGSSTYLTRTTGLIASTGAMTILGAFRRTADRNADSVVLELQSAGGGTVHTVATSGNGDRLRLYANWASQLAETSFDFTNGQIVFVALRGNGTTLSLSISTNLGGSWATVSVTQSVFTPAAMFVLNNDRGEPFHGGVCYLSEFDRYMSDSELSAQAASASIVVATGLRSFKKGIEATLGDALTGTNGTAFTSSGTLSVNTDAPSFPSSGPDPDPAIGWYALIDATDPASMYQNINLTGQPVVDGNRVGAVLDISGNGNHWRAWDGDSTRPEYKSADGGYIEITDNYHRGMAIDGTNRLVDGRKAFWVVMLIKRGGPINSHAVLMDKDYSENAPLGDEFAAALVPEGLFCRKLIDDVEIGPTVNADAINESNWGVVSFGYDGTNLTARVNLETKGSVADTRPMANDDGYMALRIGGNGPSIVHYKAVGFLDYYPSPQQEEAAITALMAGVIDPGPSPGAGLITIAPGGIIEYHGDSTIRGHNSIDGNRVATPAPERFSAALGGIYTVRNKGYGLASTVSLLAGSSDQIAWEDYVPASDADVFIINHGINDNYGGTSTVEQYGLNLAEIVSIVRDAGKQIIFETSNPVNSAPQINYVNKMREVAAALGVPLIDQHAYLMSVLNGAPVFDICPDGTHPSQATYLLKGDYAAGVFQSFLTEGPGPDPNDDVHVQVGGELDLMPAFITVTATAEAGAVTIAGQFEASYGVAVTITVVIRDSDGELVVSSPAEVDQNAHTFNFGYAIEEDGDYTATVTLASNLGNDVSTKQFTVTLPSEEPGEPDPEDPLKVVPTQTNVTVGEMLGGSPWRVAQVVDLDGRGREGLALSVDEPDRLELQSGTTDANGRLFFRGLAPGVANITIANPGGNPATLNVQVVVAAAPEPEPEPGVSALKLVNPISGMSILDGPHRITVVDQDDNPLPEDRDNALVITISKPGYVRSGKRAYGGVITLAPEAVGTSTVQLSYDDPTYGKVTLQFSVSVLP